MKRKPNSSIPNKDSGPQKKLKISNGPDIPSSNLISDKGKSKTHKMPFKIPTKMSSVPDIPLKMKQDPTQMLYKMAIPEKYKEVLGPDVNDLKKYAKEKEKKEQYLKNLVAKGLIQPPQKAKPEEEAPKKEEPVKNVFLDESGRMKDDKGNIINLKPKAVSVLKVNINRQKDAKVQAMLKHTKGASLSSSKDQKFFDQYLLVSSAAKRAKKKTHAFHFIEKGSIIKKAETLRKRITVINKDTSNPTESQKKNEEIEKSSLSSSLSLGLKRVSIKVKHHDPIPDIEWWDAPLLTANKRSYLANEESFNENRNEAISSKLEYGNVENHEKNLELLQSSNFSQDLIRMEKITNMIEHPIPFKVNQSQNVIMPMYLTKEERKKIKRRKRMEKEKEKQDKIRLGLMKPPPPKVKLSNMMRVLGNEAIADPSKVEKDVKKSIAERLKNHLARNEGKKLTREMKKEKTMRKLKRDSAIECRVAVFRVEDLSNRSHRFKVDKNANQLALHGICLICDKKSGLNLPCIVVVEGGPKAIKFYKKLMVKRIKWERDTRHHKGEAIYEENLTNRCDLVWEGVVKDHNFKKWTVLDIRSEVEGKKSLSDRGVEYYWDMVLNYQPPT